LRSGAAQDLAEVTGDQGELVLLLPLQLIGVGVGGALWVGLDAAAGLGWRVEEG
jgi:hypothetical protein